MASPARVPKKPTAILSLSLNAAEWLEAGANGTDSYAQVEGVFDTAEGAIKAALEARKAAGGVCSEVSLVLCDGLVDSRQLELPKLPKRELARIMERKAQRILAESSPGKVLYSCSQQSAEEESEMVNWTLHVMNHERLRPIMVGLRGAGIHIQRVTAEDHAVLDRAVEHQEETDEGTICVVVGPRKICVTLIANGNVLFSEELRGDYHKMPHLAASLLQSINTTAGYHRRMGRGSRVGNVVVLGLDIERGRLLCDSIRSTLSEAHVVCFPDRNGDEGPLEIDSVASEREGRREVLRSCRINGRFSPRLGFRLPAQRSSVLVSALFAVLVSIGSYLYTNAEVENRIDSLESQIQSTSQDSAELALLEANQALALQSLTKTSKSLARTQSLSERGANVSIMMEALVDAIGGKAGILRVILEKERNGKRDLRVDAVARGDSIAAIQNVSDIQRGLEGNALFSAVSVELPSRVSSSQANTSLQFSLQMNMEQIR